VSAEVAIPQWGPVVERPVGPRIDSAPRGSAPVAGQAWVPEPTGSTGTLPWGDVAPDDELDDSALDDTEGAEERSYSLLHWVVLLFLALVLGALIYLLMNQATGGPGSPSSAGALLGTPLIHAVALRSS
jgi:hypothetical protein